MPDNALEAARLAIDRLTRHEKTCDDRYKSIEATQATSILERNRMHEENQKSFQRLYGLIWKLVIGCGAAALLTLIGWVAALLWYIITHNNGVLP